MGTLQKIKNVKKYKTMLCFVHVRHVDCRQRVYGMQDWQVDDIPGMLESQENKADILECSCLLS